MKVELLYFEGCPHHVQARELLQKVLDDEGIADPITPVLVETPEKAQETLFLGCPTIRIDGRDIEPAAAGRTDYGFSCRVYNVDGTSSGTPPDNMIRAAIRGALQSAPAN